MQQTNAPSSRMARLHGGLTDHAERAFWLIAVSTMCFGFAMAAQQNIVSNFFENQLGLKGSQFGYITAIREIPGFLLIFLAALFYRLSLPHLTAGALVLLSIGYGLFGTANSFGSVIPWVVISSMGYHTFLQTQSALGMSLTTESRSGAILGRLGSINQAGSLIAMAVVIVVFHFHLISFKGMFIICGVAALLAAWAISRFPNLHDGVLEEVRPTRDPIVFKRDYSLYYLLCLLDGARQQIFFSFGLWVLVHHFRFGVPAVSAIMLVTSLLSMLFGPWIGSQIDAHGEKTVLGIVNVSYILALLGYGLIDNSAVATVCYVVYSFIFPLSAMGSSVYLRKIAPRRDIAPSLAMGLSIQHVAAIVVPIATGYILNFVGYQVPFLVACVFASMTIIVTRRLDPVAQKTTARRAEDAAAA